MYSDARGSIRRKPGDQPMPRSEKQRIHTGAAMTTTRKADRRHGGHEPMSECRPDSSNTSCPNPEGSTRASCARETSTSTPLTSKSKSSPQVTGVAGGGLMVLCARASAFARALARRAWSNASRRLEAGRLNVNTAFEYSFDTVLAASESRSELDKKSS